MRASAKMPKMAMLGTFRAPPQNRSVMKPTTGFTATALMAKTETTSPAVPGDTSWPFIMSAFAQVMKPYRPQKAQKPVTQTST